MPKAETRPQAGPPESEEETVESGDVALARMSALVGALLAVPKDEMPPNPFAKPKKRKHGKGAG